MFKALEGAMGEALARVAAETIAILPNLLASVLILLFGILVGFVIGRLINWLLTARHLDRTAARLGLATSLEPIGIRSVVRAISVAVQWGTILLASITALRVLDARLAEELTRRFVLYLPDLAVAVVILAGGSLVAKYLSRAVLIAAVNSEIRPARLLSGLTRAVVMMTAVAIAFEHLGVGRTTMLVAFGVVVGAMGLAAAVAIGLGAQDLVRQWLSEQVTRRASKGREARFQHW